MRHHIIVKFNDQVQDKAALLKEVTELFAESVQLPGVTGYTVHPNVIDRDNRYDMMIVIHMDKETLPIYDACPMHKRWKSEYGHLIEKKAIFDCE